MFVYLAVIFVFALVIIIADPRLLRHYKRRYLRPLRRYGRSAQRRATKQTNSTPPNYKELKKLSNNSPNAAIDTALARIGQLEKELIEAKQTIDLLESELTEATTKLILLENPDIYEANEIKEVKKF